MAAKKKKKSVEVEWKLTEITRQIAGYTLMIAGLEKAAALPNVPPVVLVDLENARAMLAALKLAKREPSLLQVHTHRYLRDPEARARLERYRASGTGWSRAAAARLLAVTETEGRRIKKVHGSVEKFFATTERNRALAKVARAASNKHAVGTVRDIVRSLACAGDLANAPPAVVWGSMRAALEHAFGKCVETSPERLEYPFYSKSKRRDVTRSLSRRQFWAVLREVRAKRR